MTGPQWTAPLDSYTVSDWNVVSFGDFDANTGDVEGRLAVRGSCKLGNGFSIGYEIINVGANRTDNVQPYSLVVGKDLTWGSGALYPDRTGIPHGSQKEDMYVGGTVNAPSYLEARRTGGPCAGCLDKAFDDIRPWYQNLGIRWASHPTNMVATYNNGGIFLTANDQFAARYYVHIPADIFTKSTYFSGSGINVGAEFIVTIDGGDVEFSGGDMPSISERTVFNIVGKRNVYNKHTIKGSLLAPDSVLYQTGGDEIGFVVVGDIKSFVQSRKPFCNIMCCVKWGLCHE